MVVVSAPGKILLVGGYLVLEEANAGLVVAVDKRFYCECQQQQQQDQGTTAAHKDDAQITIHVDSPQFASRWTYVWKDGQLTQEQEEDNTTPRNVFLEKTLYVVGLYLDWSRSSAATTLSLRVAADNDFYSLVPHLQHNNLQLHQGRELPVCLPAAKNADGKIYKTGLGSSACLVVAVVGALLQQEQVDREKTCALAQIAHCFAQGKVGSGFDVSAAIYGSHVYQRFPKSVLADLLVQLESGVDCREELQQLVNNKQDSRLGCGVQAPVHAFGATSGCLLQVIMADVSGGSESPSMARKVLQWKQAQQHAGDNASIPHWDDLAKINPQIVSLLVKIHSISSSTTSAVALKLAISHAHAWPALDPVIGPLLLDLRHLFQQQRHHLKAMGIAAGNVPIEPDVATALCDATSALPGVVAAVVPGAGGYDAVACVVVRGCEKAVAKVWAAYAPVTVCALTVQGVDYGEGVRLESAFPLAG